MEKKRHETKVRLLEQKVTDVKKEMVNQTTLKGPRKSKQSSKGMTNDNESYDQLQTQLEINQILIDKLDSMGVDVRELIRNSQAVSPEQQAAQDQQQQQQEQDIRMVIFTFVGPEGLIEGGDNQQFEMPIDFNQVSQVDEIKEILKRELVMDMGIDLVLHEKQSGQLLEHIEDVHIAIDSGEGILVQFIENGEGEDGNNRYENNMANINERDEQSEYSDEAFEDEDGEMAAAEEEAKVPMVPRITQEKVGNGLKHIRLLFMIKKVPKTHMVSYVLKGEKVTRSDETGEEVISTRALAQIFERKFNFGSKKATKVARFFVEGPPDDNLGDQIADKEHSADRETLIMRFKAHVGDYMLYNSLALESMLSRLQGIMGAKKDDFLEDLNMDDEDSNSYLPFEQIQKVWKLSGLPNLDEELTEFMEFLALRCSSSLKRVKYEELCQIFNEDFSLGSDCQHDDETPFNAADDDEDDQVLEMIRRQRDTAANTAVMDELPQAGASQQAGEGDEPEIDSDDLMLFIDEALFKLVAKLPGDKKKTILNKELLPLARVTTDEQS